MPATSASCTQQGLVEHLRTHMPWLTLFQMCMHSYDNPRQVPEDFAKDPPAMPPHLQLTLLNVPSVDGEAQSLPRPQHVILNHLYCQRNSRSINATVVGTTHRYKSKYVTTVMYKPKRRRSAARRGLDHGGDHAMSGA